jgi:hypothetical protein
MDFKKFELNLFCTLKSKAAVVKKESFFFHTFLV